MKRGEHVLHESGEEAAPPEWVLKFQKLAKEVGMYSAAVSLYGLIYPLTGINWLVVMAMANLNRLQADWFDRTRWGNGQTDKKNGAETSARQSMEDQETDDSGGSEVPLDDIKGEGTDSLGSFPFDPNERSTQEDHQQTDDAEEEPDDDVTLQGSSDALTK